MPSDLGGGSWGSDWGSADDQPVDLAPDDQSAAEFEREEVDRRGINKVAREHYRHLRGRQLAQQRVDREERDAQAQLAGPTLLDWETILSTDYGAVEFVTQPLLQAGQQVSLVASGKEGKSLFCWEWACRLANGHPFLQSAGGEPLVVGYLDYENSHSELQRRAHTTGYDKPGLLTNLRYVSFPQFGPLDTPTGAAGLIAWVDEHQPQVLFIDTISRTIAGKENDSDTWLQLYRLAWLPLKARGISIVRLDHYGKDKERGSRGSSAKSQDIDAEWTMQQTPNGLLVLRRTYSRSGIGDSLVLLRRLGNPQEWGTTAHELVTIRARPDGDQRILRAVEVAKLLDEAGLPATIGRPAAVAWLAEHEKGVRKEILEEALRLRKTGDHLFVGDLIQAQLGQERGEGEQGELPFDPYNNR